MVSEQDRIFTFDALEAEKTLTAHIMSHLRHTPTHMARLNPYVFEELIAEFYAAKGLTTFSLGRDPSSGADIMALSKDIFGDEFRYLIEVKRHKDRIGIEEIHRILGVMKLEKPIHGWDVAVLWSASGFCDFRKTTPSDLRKFGLQLKDADNIEECLRDYRPSTQGGLWLPNDWRQQKPKHDVD